MSHPTDKFSIAFERSPLALTITSLATGKLVDVNDGFVRISGYSRDEAIGKSPDELGLWVDAGLRTDRFAKLQVGETVPEIEARFRLKNGDIAIGVIGSAIVEIDGQACVLSSVLDITARKRAEEALLDHERRYRSIVDSQIEMVCRFRRDGTILFANAAYARARATTPEALAGANFWNFVPQEDHANVAAMLDGLSPDVPEVSIENHFQTTGGVRWTLWTNRALTFDADGRVVELQSSGLDITERKLAEEALRKSESRYRHIFETAGVSIWDEDASELKGALDMLRQSGVRDFAGYFRDRPDWVDLAIGLVRIREVNPASVRMFGARTQSELLQSLHATFVPESREVFVAQLLAIAEGREKFEAETQLKTLDGRRLDVLFSVRFPPPGSPFDRILVTLTDITERKRAEMALRENAAQLRSFADTAPAILWATEPDGRCSFLSRAWFEFTGQGEGEALGWGWLSAVHAEDRERSGEIFADANARQQSFGYEYRLRGADGEYRWMLDTGRPRFDDHGSFLGFVGSVIDIHDRKLAEMKVRSSEAHFRSMAEALQKSNRAKDEFLATLSHELRTPLNAVLGWAHMLRSGTLPPEIAARALDSLERNAKAQTQLIDDLLDMSRIVAGRLQIASDKVNMSAVIAGAVDTVRPAAVSKGVALHVALAAEPCHVKGDADRLRQILWNLLSNAIKFTPAGGSIHLELRAAGPHVEVIVRDTGEGIEPQFLPYVFERFRQADASSTRRHGGLGLGLSIARHLAEEHTGQIEAQSDGRQRGATFTLRLPRLEAAGAQRSLSPAGDSDDERLLRGVTLLVVDDEEDARELLRVALELAGGRVVTACSAADALQALTSGPVDIVLADIGLPEHDGLDLIRAIRALPAPLGQLPALAVTAYTSPRDRGLALDAGFNAHVGKPLVIERLLNTVADTLNLRHERAVDPSMR